ncbi:MAG: 3-deoxy-7-phosphoheptulonate synthase [Eubacterium sp.]|nr:3-deoxy-7-phosphoheptulonate synthase [Eubacterium sp.]
MDNMVNTNFKRKLPIPQEIKEQYPLSKEASAIKEARDKEIASVFKGESDKFLLIIGPCSADRADSVLDYINRLADVQKEVEDKILIIPRIYTGKPRTTGAGYKGMLHQPDPDKKPDMLEGIIAIRSLHKDAIEKTGLTCADEMLYPQNLRYISDLVSYAAVGARSVENQEHRLVASALNIPVGMKNPTSGDFNLMLNAIKTAQRGHTFLYRGWEVESSGNGLSHAVLRGSIDKHGMNHKNYGFKDLSFLASIYCTGEYENPAVIIDTNHSNSDKNCFEQQSVVSDVLLSRKKSAQIHKLVKGFMIESYLEDGCQSVDGGVYGKSITDPCLGWDKTKNLIYNIYNQI